MLFYYVFLSVLGPSTHDCLWWWDQDPTFVALHLKVTSADSGFQKCLRGPGLTPFGCCSDCYDVDSDGDVDLRDFARYTNCMSIIFQNEQEVGDP